MEAIVIYDYIPEIKRINELMVKKGDKVKVNCHLLFFITFYFYSLFIFLFR